MNKKHRQTLEAIFRNPVSGTIVWKDVEALVVGLGGEVDERRNGSRVALNLNGIRTNFHRPHPRKEADKGAIKDIRRFLSEAGVDNDEL